MRAVAPSFRPSGFPPPLASSNSYIRAYRSVPGFATLVDTRRAFADPASSTPRAIGLGSTVGAEAASVLDLTGPSEAVSATV